MYFSNFFDYLKKEKNYSDNTIVAYKKDINTFSKFCSEELNKKNISHLDYKIIRNWIVKLSDSNLSPLTINRKISALSRYYDFLIKINEIKESPLKKHKRLKVQPKIIIPFSEEEVLTVIDVFQDDFEGKRNMLIIEMLYSTGLRRDELINIKIDDIFFDDSLIKVRGKRNKERLVPIITTLKQSMDIYLELRNQVKTKFNNLIMLLFDDWSLLSVLILLLLLVA